MSNIRIIIIFFIFSEGFVAWYGAQAAWRTRKNDKRTIIGMLVAGALTLYGLSRFLAFGNSFKFGQEISQCIPPEMELRSLVTTIMQTTAMWVFALTFAGGEHPGVVRRGVNRLLARWQ